MDGIFSWRSALGHTHSGIGYVDVVPRWLQIREGDWKVAPLPKDFQDRRVEITGPTDRKMVINALNSGGLAAVCMCVL